MPATDPEPALMEETRALEELEGSSTNTPPSAAPTKAVPSSTPPDPTIEGPSHFPRETAMETKAVSMASNDCSSARSSPAEASPAKPAAAPPTTSEGAAETSPSASHIASASDSLAATGSSPVSASESALQSTTYGVPGAGKKYPAVLTFQGVSVTLENNGVWEQFYSCGTEMILTKQGRRMFPYCRYRLSGLDPQRRYSLVLSIVPSNKYKYRWNTTKWEVTGRGDQQGQCLSRAFPHHYSPCLGAEWMNTLVSFYKLKLTNQPQDRNGFAVLHSLQRYIPRLHVIPAPDENAPSLAQPVIIGPESLTFTFPQTEFMAVTTYQNFRITQLKINHNPFAKGFRDDGNNLRLTRLAQAAEAKPVVMTEPQSLSFIPAQPNVHLFFRMQESGAINSKDKEKVVDLSTNTPSIASATFSNEQVTRLVLKPIMSPSTGDDPYVPCLRGKHSLGELVLVEKRPLVESTEEPLAATTNTPATSTPIQGSSPGTHRRRKRINRRWANSRGREWKAAVASPTVFHSPSLTVAMQPELDDVEGLLFVSFTSKEALEVHIGDKPANSTPLSSPITPMTPMEKVDVVPETDEEVIGRLEAILLQDLRLLKHRQVIHPVLQEVGMKLSLLDPMKSIDLQYLGVQLPLSAPNLPEKGEAVAPRPGDKGTSFISRTGKTSDITQIKGWRDKFIRNKETSPSNCEGPLKNRSAFCSNMLDEYLESEAQCISERVATLSTNCEDSVVYQLPVKSSSYVKTLDSVLQHRKAAPKFPVGATRPCPLSHKPLLYSALASPAPPLATAETPVEAAVEAEQPPPSSQTVPVAQRLSTYVPELVQRPAVTPRASGLSKNRFTMIHMELGAMSRGLGRTHLTEDRLALALSSLLTKQMLPSEVHKVSKYPKYKATLPECGQDFCTLGCVCLSLRRTNRAPFHCRRPECMFSCACFKRRITKQLSLGASEELIQPLYSMSNMDNVSQPHPGSHANKLWNRHTHQVDPEPLFTPKRAALHFPPLKNLKRSSGAHVTQPIREEDKGPVYKYLESMMTCARVREFNSAPPPKFTIDPKVLDGFAQGPKAKQQETAAADQPKSHSPQMVEKTAKKASVASSEKEAKKQIEIQSACQWMKDRQMVLEALCQRMNQNRLSRRFWVGPYLVRPVAKIFMRKPSGSIVTYRLHISKPSKASDVDGDESDDSDEENPPVEGLDLDPAEEDEFQFREPDVQIAVTPFMTGVVPAGRLKVRTKPVGCQASGLIQVNGKSYNQARLMLGNMGSLHPANRLAAFVTGRLRPPAGISLKVSWKSDPTNKKSTPDSPHPKPAGTVVPPVATARGAADLKPPAQMFPIDFWMKGSANPTQNTSTFNPFASSNRSAATPFQSSSTSSPVSLTVSPALKTPSFLGKSGTYSFRICPPANQRTRSRNLPGVTLPGGFTLIELPQHGANGGAPGTASAACADGARPQKEASLNVGHSAAVPAAHRVGPETCAAAKDQSGSMSRRPEPAPELACDVTVPSDLNNESNSREEESNPDVTSEDLSSDSDSSDYCAGGDEDDSDVEVDIETVDESAVNEVKDVLKALKDSGGSSAGLGSQTELDAKEFKDNRRRTNHTVLERQRRSEQRILFDKLQTVLQSDPRAPRLRLLTLAVTEIQNLEERSRGLEERKRRLTRMQAVYVKELSLLSGKSDMLIKNKLKEICEKQKGREKKPAEKPEGKPEEKPEWKPFFSNLLSSRAALLQPSAPKSKQPPKPLSLTEIFKTSSPNAAQDKLMSLLHSNLNRPPGQPGAAPPAPPLPPASFAARVQVPDTSPPAGPPQKTEEQPEKQVGCPASQTAGAPPSSQASASGKPPPLEATTTFSLPLIRSKTGRIILPSSLKPLGHGFYTLMVMEPRKKGQEGAVNMSPSDVEALVRQAQSLSSGSPGVLEEGGTVPASPLSPGLTPPPDKSGGIPSRALRAAKKGRAGGAAAGSDKACVKHIPVAAGPNRRGRPRKRPLATRPGGDDGRSETSPLAKTGRNKMASKGTGTQSPGPAGGGPPTVKRPRGRPPKRRSTQMWSPPVSRSGSLPSDCGPGGPSPGGPDSKRRAARDGGARRPLTRGSLGKDFPSAKKRSWIDVEKELEPEIKSDLESESE